MRRGTIFERALKWMALVGLVFALGGGQALAQTPDATVKIDLGTTKPKEGGALVPVTVTVTPTATATVPATATVTLELVSDPEADTTPPSDTRGELGATGDVSWEGAARDSATSGALTFSWGESRRAESKTINLRTYRDTDAENEKFIIRSATTGLTNAPAVATRKFEVQDVETQRYVLRHPFNNSGEIDEGTDGTMLELEAVPLKTGPVTFRVTLHSERDGLEDYSLSTATASISEEFTIPQVGETSAGVVQVPFVTEDNDEDRIDDTVTFEVTYATGDMRGDPAAGMEEEYYTLKVIDQHKLPSVKIASDGGITIKVDGKDVPVETLSLSEGDTATVKLVPDRSPDDVPDGETIEVAVEAKAGSTAEPSDYDIRNEPVKIEGTEDSGTFTLEVELDQDVGPEELILMAVVTGDDMYDGDEKEPEEKRREVELGTISFIDTTSKKIEPRTGDEVHAAIDRERMEGAGDNGRWTAGETMTLMASDLFKWPATTTSVVLGNSISEDQQVATATTSNDSLMIKAVSSGMTEISVTATVVGEASGFMPTQTVSTSATVKFPVTVDADAITVMSQADVDAAVAAAIKKAADMATSKQWEPGGATAMVPLSELFDRPESITAIYDASSSDMGDVEAGISSDKMYVTLMPKSAGTAMITVTAADTASGGSTATVSFDATVMAQAAIVGKSQDEVNKVFMDNGAGDLVAGGSAVMFGMGELFIVAPGVTPTYTVQSSAAAVGANATGAMLTLTPVSAGSAKITVTAMSGDNTATVSADVMVGLSDLTVTVTAEPMAIMEGGTSTVTATASRMVAAADGEVKVELDVVGDATLDMESITIMAGSTEGFATLTATPDEDDYEDETVVVIASGSGISGATRITITVEDIDMAPGSAITAKDNAGDLILAAVNAVAGGAEWMVGGMVAQVDMSTLFDVDEGVTPIYAGTSSADAVTASSSGNMLMLTPAAAGTATITVTASDSASGSSASASADVTVALEALVVTVTASANAVDEGGSITLTAKANRNVTADREVSLQVAGDAAAVEVADSITIAAGTDMGEAALMAVEDDDTQNANVTVVASGAGIATPITMDIAVTDNDRTVNAKSQTDVDAVFVAAIGGDFLPGGAAATVDMSMLFTTTGSPSVGYMAESSNTESVMASTSGSMLTLTPVATGTAMVSVTATDSTGDADDTATVSYNATVGVLPLKVTVTPPMADVAEGGTVEITATANKMVDANVEVMLIRDATSSAGEDDYSLAPSAMITIMAGESMGKVTLTATDDIETEPAESLTLVARVKDLGDVGTVMVTIAASDPTSMFTLSGGPADMNLMEGESYELTVTADPAVQADTEVPIMRDRAASSADDADFTVAAVMLKAGDASGTTMLMVTEDGMDDSGHGMPEELVLYIADGGSNQRLSFKIWDAAVPALPIIAQLLLAAFLAVGGYRRYLRR